MSDDFEDPSGYFDPAANIDNLLLIKAVAYREDYPAFDKKKAAEGEVRDGVQAIVTVVAGDGAGTVYDESTIHQGQLVKALKGRVGGAQLLGVLALGEAKGGYKAPYLLLPASDEQKKVARAFLEARSEVPF